MRIIHPNGEVMFHEDVSNEKSFEVIGNLTSETNYYYSSRTRFTFEVQAKKAS